MLRTLEPAVETVSMAPGVHQHLRRSLQTVWRAYRKSFKRCRKDFSEASVHELRVCTRRLLAMLNLLQPLVGAKTIEPPCCRLKTLMRRFASLRDTHVQLLYVEDKRRTFTGTEELRCALRRRERRLTHKLDAHMCRARLGPLKKEMAAVRKEVRCGLVAGRSEPQHWKALLGALEKAFADVANLRRHCRTGNVAAIHKMRVAFKRFRYALELLKPVLPGVTKRQIDRMHLFQTRMGEIQDAEVLLKTLDEFGKKPKAAKAMQSFRHEVEHRRAALVRVFLAHVDQLDGFWPLHHAARRHAVKSLHHHTR